tara:strand:+ start:19910 stop:20836 length:927 start_codon:yes stop_codon:yes gene_type:complete
MVLISDIIIYLKKELKIHDKDILIPSDIKINKLKNIKSDFNSSDGDISWISNKVFYQDNSRVKNFKGSLLFVPYSYMLEIHRTTYIIRCKNPKYIFNMVANRFFLHLSQAGITKNSLNNSNLKKSIKNTYLSQGTIIGKNVTIGKYVNIDSNTVLNNCKIGNNVNIGANCTIGNVGFGFSQNEKDEYIRFPHIGKVIIKDNVEIDNNVCIDRGSLDNTVIGKGVKIDNQTHISHNVKVGANTVICPGVTISGSVLIGNNCWIAPQSVILNQIRIGNKVSIGIGSVVINDIESKQSVFGNPARLIPNKK